MAINFLNTVDLNKNQLNNAAIQNLATDPGSGVEGQIYFNTAVDALKIYAGGAWVEVGATSGVETFTNANGTYVAFGTENTAAIGNVTVGTIDLTAVDGTSTSADRFLTKNNKWATIPFGDITGVVPATGNALKGISVSSQSGPVPVVGLDIVGQTNLGATPDGGDELLIYDTSTTTNKTVTVSNLVGGFETTYDLTTAPTGTAVRLTSSDAGDPAEDVTISGFSGQTTMTRISDTELRVALTPTVTIANSLTLTNGAFTQTAGGENNLNANLDMNTNKLLNVATGTDDTDGVNWGQVRDAIAGVGLFQGGYNATTGLTINLSSNGSLDGASNIELDKGDYFVVTTPGTAFYGVTLEVGDMIFANVDIAANSNPAQSVYTTVIQDANIAGAGASDGATQKGVAGFDSANFTVSGTGWVQLKEEVLSGRMAKITLTGGDNSVAGETTFTVNLVTLFGSGAAADDAIATVKEEASNLIVYPKVTGNGTGSLDIVFMPQVANSAYRAVISIV
jgi:hypothetical protein